MLMHKKLKINRKITITNFKYIKTPDPIFTLYLQPLFVKLSDTWYKLQNEVIFLSKINKTMTHAQTYMQQIEIPRLVLNTLLGEAAIMTDADRLAADVGLYRISKIQCKGLILSPNEMKNRNDVEVEVSKIYITTQ